MYKPTTAIMATGGMDSTVLLYQYKDVSPVPITIDYGQAVIEKQIEMLQFHINRLGLPDLEVIKINFEDWQKKPGLFTKNYVPQEDYPLGDWDKLRYSSFFIEGRNMIMVAYAMAFCSSKRIDQLLAGYLYSEKEWMHRRSYKLMTGDNSPHFVDMINLMSMVGFSHQVRFRAPYYEMGLSKRDVYQIGLRLGVDFDKTYSCYFVPECGKCDNCLLREQIMTE